MRRSVPLGLFVRRRCLPHFDEMKIVLLTPFGKAKGDHENGDQCDQAWCLTCGYPLYPDSYVHLCTYFDPDLCTNCLNISKNWIIIFSAVHRFHFGAFL